MEGSVTELTPGWLPGAQTSGAMVSVADGPELVWKLSRPLAPGVGVSTWSHRRQVNCSPAVSVTQGR
jgi:hypothetical protein